MKVEDGAHFYYGQIVNVIPREGVERISSGFLISALLKLCALSCEGPAERMYKYVISPRHARVAKRAIAVPSGAFSRNPQKIGGSIYRLFK